GPSALRRERIREKKKTGEYLIADSLPALISLAQMDILEIHTWNSRCTHIEQPDRIVIDLDPGEHVAWKAVVDAAILVRALLATVPPRLTTLKADPWKAYWTTKQTLPRAGIGALENL